MDAKTFVDPASAVEDPEFEYYSALGKYEKELWDMCGTRPSLMDKRQIRAAIHEAFGRGPAVAETLTMRRGTQFYEKHYRLAWPWLDFPDSLREFDLTGVLEGGTDDDGAYEDICADPEGRGGCYGWRLTCKVRALGQRHRISWGNRQESRGRGPGCDGMLERFDEWTGRIRERMMKARAEPAAVEA